MSEPRVAAVVCEGQTDVPIFREIIQALWPSVEEVRSLQPELDELGRATLPAGWTRVRDWCQQHADRLDEVLDPFVGSPIDLLLVAIDLDIALEAGIADPPNDVGAYEARRLRETMTDWMLASGRRRLPPEVVLSTPVRSLEAWIIAALYPRERAPEQIDDAASWLVTKGKLRRSPSDRKPWKELHRYRLFASTVAAKLRRVRAACGEAARTCGDIEVCRDRIER